MEWEQYKQNIRKVKERLLVFDIKKKKCKDPKKATKIATDIQKTKDKIKSFEAIGPTDL